MILKDAILNKIAGTIGTSFAELGNIDGFRAERGDQAMEMCLPGYPTVLLWAGVTKAAADAMDDLLRERRIEMSPCEALVYMIDGKAMTIPQVGRKLRQYKSPRWLPVTFNAVRGKAKPKLDAAKTVKAAA